MKRLLSLSFLVLFLSLPVFCLDVSLEELKDLDARLLSWQTTLEESRIELGKSQLSLARCQAELKDAKAESEKLRDLSKLQEQELNRLSNQYRILGQEYDRLCGKLSRKRRLDRFIYIAATGIIIYTIMK